MLSGAGDMRTSLTRTYLSPNTTVLAEHTTQTGGRTRIPAGTCSQTYGPTHRWRLTGMTYERTEDGGISTGNTPGSRRVQATIPTGTGTRMLRSAGAPHH